MTKLLHNLLVPQRLSQIYIINLCEASDMVRAPLSSQVAASFTRGRILAPEIGPQAFGVTPLQQQFRIVSSNSWPTAVCTSRTVNADIPTDQVNISLWPLTNCNNRRSYWTALLPSHSH